MNGFCVYCKEQNWVFVKHESVKSRPRWGTTEERKGKCPRTFKACSLWKQIVLSLYSWQRKAFRVQGLWHIAFILLFFFSVRWKLESHGNSSLGTTHFKIEVFLAVVCYSDLLGFSKDLVLLWWCLEVFFLLLLLQFNVTFSSLTAAAKTTHTSDKPALLRLWNTLLLHCIFYFLPSTFFSKIWLELCVDIALVIIGTDKKQLRFNRSWKPHWISTRIINSKIGQKMNNKPFDAPGNLISNNSIHKQM